MVARQMVRGLIDVLGWDDMSRNDISIAVTEACTNAVLHAYPDGEGSTRSGGLSRSAWSSPCATRGRGSPRASIPVRPGSASASR